MIDDYEDYPIEEVGDIQCQLSKPATIDDREAIKTGRKTKYNDEMPNILFDYFNRAMKYKEKEERQVSHSVLTFIVERHHAVPSIAGFCRINGLGRTTFWRWVQEHEEFRNVYEWGKTIIEEMITQRLIDGSVDSKNIIVLNQIMNKYDKDLMALPQAAIEDTAGVEETPKRKKGYDLADIDSYCKPQTIETTATEVKDGEEKSVP